MYISIIFLITSTIFFIWAYKLLKRQTKIFDEKERNEKEFKLMIDDINKLINDLRER